MLTLLCTVLALSLSVPAVHADDASDSRDLLHAPAVHKIPTPRAWAVSTATGVSLSVNTTVLPYSGSWVTVTWTATASALPLSSADVIAYFVPANACNATDCTSTAPVKFANLTVAGSGLTGKVGCVCNSLLLAPRPAPGLLIV
jgi:hypothetical protein